MLKNPTSDKSATDVAGKSLTEEFMAACYEFRRNVLSDKYESSAGSSVSASAMPRSWPLLTTRVRCRIRPAAVATYVSRFRRMPSSATIAPSTTNSSTRRYSMRYASRSCPTGSHRLRRDRSRSRMSSSSTSMTLSRCSSPASADQKPRRLSVL